MKESDKLTDVVVLEWTFSPPDYFEAPIHIIETGYDMTIDAGKVEARINPGVYDQEHRMRGNLHQALIGRFLGVQLLCHRPYKLSNASMSRLHPDGRKDVTLFVESCVMTMSGGTVDFIVKDKEGNVVSDSRKDRIEQKKELSELAGKFHGVNALATLLLNSYQAAVIDPSNELVHLYEIPDALSKNFGGESAAIAALGFNAGRWSQLKKIANDAHLKQGRHRGISLGELRDATGAELNEARTISRDLVEGYLQYLDKNA